MPDAAIRCRALVKHYGAVRAVDGIDLDVHRAECFGMLGPNGAGKTTTIEMLQGLLVPDGGEVTVLDLRWDRDEARLRERLGSQLQETKLPEKLTVEEVVRLFGSFYHGGRAVDEVLALVELGEKRTTWVGKLSGGQRQRLAVACALVGEPEVLFLDEPTTGLDPQSRRQVWAIIAEFQSRGGTVVLTTHYMEEAERLCDRVAIVDRGKIIALDTPRALIASLGAEHVVEFAVEGGAGMPSLEELEALAGVEGVVRDDGTVRLTAREVHRALPALLRYLDERGVVVGALTTHHATLEDVFLALTGRHLRDA